MGYPFNSIGFYDYVRNPIEQFFKKNRIIKTDIWDWDLYNTHEVIFDLFENFCKNYPFKFVDQYVCNTKYSYPGCDYETSLKQNEPYLILHDIQNYVCNIRKENKAKLDYISEEWCKPIKNFYVPYKNDSDWSKWVTRQDYEVQVDWELDYDTLKYTMKKVWKDESNFNPLDIERVLYNLDIKMAMKIVELSGCI